MPKVFISYSHDSNAHIRRVLDLYHRLKKDGINDCTIDEDTDPPEEGWPIWMANQIESSDFVLVVCTENYHRRIRGEERPGSGLGATWEGKLITQELYESQGKNKKFIPIVFSKEDTKWIPLFLRPWTYYLVSSELGYEGLLRHILETLEEAIASRGGNDIKPSKHNSLVLLHNLDSKWTVLEAESIKFDDELELVLIPVNSKDNRFFFELKKEHSSRIGVSFSDTAAVGVVEQITQKLIKGKTYWQLRIIPDDNALFTSWEMGTSGYSADDLAEMRARRILLNERLSKAKEGYGNSVIEHLVQGQNNVLEVKSSPFPDLYSYFKGDTSSFLSVARLLGILWLKLSGTIEHVQNFNLEMVNDSTLFVDFEGQRPRKYENVAPRIIKVQGNCKLY